jgi:protocatechuate 3,4-dioxygenase beta subunit
MPSLAAILAALALAQPPASPDPRPVPVAGTVVDAAGRPVAGAEVWLAEAVPPAEDRRAGPGIREGTPAGPMPGEAPALASVRTDPDGKYSLAIPVEVIARPSPPSLAVWAASLGAEPRFAWHRLPRVVLPDDPPVRIELRAPALRPLNLVGPDRRPIAAARVIPARAGGLLVPEPLARALAATTDANGQAAMIRPTTGWIDQLRVEADGAGVQMLEAAESEERSAEAGTGGGRIKSIALVLAPVGRVVGRLTAPHGEPIRGATVRAISRVGGYDGSGQGGVARADCDDQGRFEIPAIAAGMVELRIDLDLKRGTTLRPWPLSRILVRPGRTTELAIPLHPTVIVEGIVRERTDGRPNPGTSLVWNTLIFHGPSRAMTDASGAFRAFVAREEIIANPSAIRPTAPFLVPVDRADPTVDLPPRGVDELTLKTIELARGAEVLGTVVDQHGEPVAGAEVEAIRPTDPPLVRSSRTDAQGRFVLHGIDPRAELVVRAWDGLAGSAAASFTPAALAGGPIALPLGPGPTTPIGGRVVDPDGRPIAGASVRLWRKVQLKPEAGPVVIEPIIQADGTTMLHTDAQGRYRTARRFPADGLYVAEASAPGRLPARSHDVRPGAGADGIPPIVLRRLRTIEGRVVDRNGQPVADALAFQSGDGPMRTEATSDRDGRFFLPGFPEGQGLVFALKDGFRRASAPCDVAPGGGEPPSTTVTLTRANEDPAVAYATLPSPLPADEEKALARRLIRPEAERRLAHGLGREKYIFLYQLASSDPEFVLERLEAAKLDPSEAAAVRIAAAEGLAAENLDEGLAIVESLATPDDRAQGYLTLIGTLIDREPSRIRPLIDQAIVNTRAVMSQNMRVYLLEQIAGRLIERGEAERAEALIREGEELARKADPGPNLAYRLANLAGLRLLIDPATALPAFEKLALEAQGGKVTVRAFAMDRYLGRAAYRLAARDPAEAERLLRRVTFTLVRPANTYVVAICARMATADLPRARELLDLITEDERVLKAYALGLMAQSIAADRDKALSLLDAAYAELGHLADRGWTSQFATIGGVAGRLLPVVERVDAARLPEFLARALALRPPAGGRNDHAFFPEQAADLAIGVARYDRDLADRILRPDLETLGSAPSPSAPVGYPTRNGEHVSRVLAALALIDPRRAVALTERLAQDEATRTFDGQSRSRVARILAAHGDTRWRSIYEHELSLWNSLQGVD